MEEEKSPAPGEIQTHDRQEFCSEGVCSTAVLQPHPLFQIHHHQLTGSVLCQRLDVTGVEAMPKKQE